MSERQKDRDRFRSPQMRLGFVEEKQVRREEDVKVKCRRCGKLFSRPRWYADKGLQDCFCSRTCRTAWEEDLGEASFHLVLEGRPEYRGGNWEIPARKARERDGFRCGACGVTEEELGRNLDVHHKVPYRLFDSPQEANRLSNLISLCPSCHKKLESEGQADMPLFDRVKHLGHRPGKQKG